MFSTVRRYKRKERENLTPNLTARVKVNLMNILFLRSHCMIGSLVRKTHLFTRISDAIFISDDDDDEINISPHDLGMSDDSQAREVVKTIISVQKAMDQRVKLGHGTPPSSHKYVRDMKRMIWYAVQSISEPFFSSYKNFGSNYHKEIEIKANFFGYYDKQFKFRVNCQSAFVNRLLEGYQEAKHLKKVLIFKNKGMRKSTTTDRDMWDIQIELITPPTN